MKWPYLSGRRIGLGYGWHTVRYYYDFVTEVL
jgi:hypothetical protein